MADTTEQKLGDKNTGKLTNERPTEDQKPTPNNDGQKQVFSGFSLGEKRKTIEMQKSPLKIGFKSKAISGISIKLGAPETKRKKVEPALQKKKGSVAAAFNEDESDEEEMPPEAKMRMKNMGRETPTSAGPNSFNKGKKGFTHHHKVFEKGLKETKPPS